MSYSRRSRQVLALAGAAVLLATAACAHQVEVLNAPPRAAYKTMGMVSGQGANDSAAMGHVLDQARRLEADAVVVHSRRQLGSAVIITCKVIRYLGPPPEAQ
jgi:hypothetical protein